MSIRSNRHELTTFSSHPKTPVALHILSLRKSTSGITNRQQGGRFVTIRPNRIKSTTFQVPTPKPSCAKYSKSRANRLLVSRIDNKGDDSCRFDQIDTNCNIFNPSSKPSGTTNSKSCANRLPLL